jgi:hypothetical protein
MAEERLADWRASRYEQQKLPLIIDASFNRKTPSVLRLLRFDSD